MKIYYSHDIFCEQFYGGVSRYFVEVIERLSNPNLNIEVISGFYFNEYLKDLKNNTNDIQISGCPIKKTRFLNKLALRIFNEIYQNYKIPDKPESILHQTYYSPFVAKKNVKVVTTVHDMVHEIFPQMFHTFNTTSISKRRSCERADKIIAVSESTKKDLVNILNVDPTKIDVIYHGSNFGQKFSTSMPYIHRKPYLLFVGMRDGYKNFKKILSIFLESKKIHDEFDLICFGGGKLNQEEMGLISEYKLEDKVFQRGGQDKILSQYYRGARALVYPSLYEGFGIPILEAMSMSCPVVCSNQSSLPEVALDAAAYFDPTDTENMTYVLESCLFDIEYLSKLSIKGKSRSLLFSWEKTARETLMIYQNLS